MYVVDEANIETHGMTPMGALADDPAWAASFLERMTRMVARDFNLPSIILWSLGNESGYGAAHDAMYYWTKRADPPGSFSTRGAVRRRRRPISFARCMPELIPTCREARI